MKSVIKHNKHFGPWFFPDKLKIWLGKRSNFNKAAAIHDDAYARLCFFILADFEFFYNLFYLLITEPKKIYDYFLDLLIIILTIPFVLAFGWISWIRNVYLHIKSKK